MARGKSELSCPISVVFRLSDRKNSKHKIKTFRNKSIDEILNENNKLAGIPDDCLIISIGVGDSFEDLYIERYNIKQ